MYAFFSSAIFLIRSNNPMLDDNGLCLVFGDLSVLIKGICPEIERKINSMVETTFY